MELWMNQMPLQFEFGLLTAVNWDMKAPLYIKENKHSILIEVDKVLRIIWIVCGCINSLFLRDDVKYIHKMYILVFMHYNIKCKLTTEIVKRREIGLLTLFSLSTRYFMALLIIHNTFVEWIILDYVYQLILEGLNYIWIQYVFHKTEDEPHW